MELVPFVLAFAGGAVAGWYLRKFARDEVNYVVDKAKEIADKSKS
jgi:hypothetical protein